MPDATPAKQRNRTAKDYTTREDVVQHMSYKMVHDTRMLEVLAKNRVTPYLEFQGRVPSKEDFKLLMGWKGSTSKWWREMWRIRTTMKKWGGKEGTQWKSHVIYSITQPLDNVLMYVSRYLVASLDNALQMEG